MRQRRWGGAAVPLRFDFVMRWRLMSGGFGVAGLWRKRDKQQAQDQQGQNPGYDLGGMAQTEFHFRPDRNQEPRHVVEIATFVHHSTTYCDNRRGSLRWAAEKQLGGVPRCAFC
jgi:hypothetical protein